MDVRSRLRQTVERMWFNAERLKYGPWQSTPRQRARDLLAMDRTIAAQDARSLAQSVGNQPLLFKFARLLEHPHYGDDDPARALWLDVEAKLDALEGHKAPGAVVERDAPLNDTADGWLACPDIARREGLDAAVLDQRLRRFRENAVPGKDWREDDPASRNVRSARYMYRLAAIQDIIDDLKAALPKMKRRSKKISARRH